MAHCIVVKPQTFFHINFTETLCHKCQHTVSCPDETNTHIHSYTTLYVHVHPHIHTHTHTQHTHTHKHTHTKIIFTQPLTSYTQSKQPVRPSTQQDCCSQPMGTSELSVVPAQHSICNLLALSFFQPTIRFHVVMSRDE